MGSEMCIRDSYWADHLRKPVRFSEAVTEMWDEDPTRILIELGPRKTLATLSKQHANDPKNQIALPTLSNTSEDLAEWHSMMTALAQLWLAGAEIQWCRISSDGNSRQKLAGKVNVPTYAFQRKRYFVQPGSKVGPVANEATNQNTLPAANAIGDVQNISQSNSISPTPNPNAPTVPQPESILMSRIPNIVSSLHEVFENTSGFDLSEFDGDTTFFLSLIHI